MLPLNSEIAFPFPARVTAVEFHAAEDEQAASIRLTLSPVQKSEWTLQLLFTGVRDVSIPKIAPEGVRCALFEVTPLSEAAWRSPKLDDVEWMVGDFKMDTLTFYAKTAEVVSIQRV